MKVIELKLSDDEKVFGEGITAISLVKYPAIEENWISFSKGSGELHFNKEFSFKTIDKEKRLLIGPAMIPDKLIYRRDEFGEEESLVFFTADTIRELAEQFLFNGKQNNMTLEHEATVNDLSIVESWIVEDSAKDKSANYGFNLPVGTWVVAVKVLNDDVWELVKNKDVAGFSVEGVFAKELIKNQKLKEMKTTKVDEYLTKIRALFNETDTTDVKKFNKTTIINEEGAHIQVQYDGEEIQVGERITHEVGGDLVDVPAGNYKVSEIETLVVGAGGIVLEIIKEEPQTDVNNDNPEMSAGDGLKTQQIDALIDGIAEIISTFKKDVKAEFSKQVKESEERIRKEFNKPSEQRFEQTPQDKDKDKIVMGLSRYVKQGKK